jgi:hypothetical protein
VEVRLNPKKFTALLAGIAVLLMVLHLLSCVRVFRGTGYPYGSLNVDYESNLPTLFSIFLLAGGALFAFLIALTKRPERMVFSQWLGLAAVFLFLCADEFMSIHEELTEPVRSMLGTTSVFYYAWVIPYALLVVVIGILYVPFLLRLPPDTRRGLILAASLYIVGGIGFELPGGAWYEAYGKTAGFYVLAMFEEGFEMAGCITFIHTFTSYLDRHVQDFRLRITSQ